MTDEEFAKWRADMDWAKTPVVPGTRRLEIRLILHGEPDTRDEGRSVDITDMCRWNKDCEMARSALNGAAWSMTRNEKRILRPEDV